MKKITFALLLIVLLCSGFYGETVKIRDTYKPKSGYTETELIASGKKGIKQKDGTTFYEGYYIAPNGKYYKVNADVSEGYTEYELIASGRTGIIEENCPEGVSCPTIYKDLNYNYTDGKYYPIIMSDPESDFMNPEDYQNYLHALELGNQINKENYQVKMSAPESSGKCNPNYSACVPNVAYDIDCNDVSAKSFLVIGFDQYGFDGDGDGIACEPYYGY